MRGYSTIFAKNIQQIIYFILLLDFLDLNYALCHLLLSEKIRNILWWKLNTLGIILLKRICQWYSRECFIIDFKNFNVDMIFVWAGGRAIASTRWFHRLWHLLNQSVNLRLLANPNICRTPYLKDKIVDKPSTQYTKCCLGP